jgi:Protein of unknown function (DUF2892)
MSATLYKSTIGCLTVLLLLPAVASAHQPRLVESRLTEVIAPEVSKAYYTTLTGEPDVYRITATEPFDLYVGLTLPAIEGQKKDVSAVILKDRQEMARLDGPAHEWTIFFEEFGHDTYWNGPEYKVRAEAGTYEIRVWSSNNDSKYVLAVGEIESFDFKETWNALTLIPGLKTDFFEKSPIDFILSPFGAGLLVAMYLLAVIFGFAYRALLKHFARGTVRGVGQNIGKHDRTVRFVLGVALLLWAITTTWSPLLLFFSGFCFFEAVFSWCGFYAALGRTTCPVE